MKTASRVQFQSSQEVPLGSLAGKLPFIGTMLAATYFGLAPIVSISQQRFFGLSVLNLIAAVSVLALALNRGPKIGKSRLWISVSLLFWLLYLLGCIRSPTGDTNGLLTYGLRLGVVWLIVSLAEMNRRALNWLLGGWAVGMCISSIIQITAERQLQFEVGAQYSNSLSRYAQSQGNFEFATQSGVLTTHGYMAMGICGIGLIICGIREKRKLWRAVKLAGAALLLVGERRGGFIAADVCVGSGMFLLILYPFLFAVKNRGAWLWTVMGYIILGLVGVTMLNLDNVSHRLERMLSFGALMDESIMLRVQLVKQSFETWMASPIWGVGLVGWSLDSYNYIGLHSSIVDVLAQLGVFGSLGYFMLMTLPLLVGLRCNGAFISATHGEEHVDLAIIGGALIIIAAALNPTFMMTLMNETSLLLLGIAALLHHQITCVQRWKKMPRCRVAG